MDNLTYNKAKDDTTFYASSAEDVLASLEVNPKTGLGLEQVTKNQIYYGLNLISKKKQANLIQLLIGQLKNPLITILLFVILVKILNLLPEVMEARLGIESVVEVLLVLAVVIITTWISVGQELKAESSLRQLKEMVNYSTRVLRNSQIITIAVKEVTVGDILILESGDRVPADSRILDSINGLTNESLLTGEAEEVEKLNLTYPNEPILPAQQKNVVFAGTSVVAGKIRAVVFAIGQNTEFGKISAQLDNTKTDETKFQKQTNSLLQILTILSLASFAFLEILYIFVFKYDLVDSVETGLSLVIAFVPEALSAVTVIVLSISASNLIKKGIIVKNLASAEGMGGVTTFLTDKTGTITEGRMTVKNLWFLDGEVEVDKFKSENIGSKRVLEILSFATNNKGATEEALEKFINRHDFKVEFFERLYEYGYSSDLKRMTVVRSHNQKQTAFTKGAGEILLPLCSSYYDHQQNIERKLINEDRSRIIAQIEEYASQGLRVLLLAYRHYPDSHDLGTRAKDEQDLVFTGLICLLDPLRVEVTDTVAKFKSARINLVMITGDHPNIAKFLGIASGICEPEDSVMTGSELEKYLNTYKLNEVEINKIYKTKIFARVSPKHKEFVVNIFKSKGEIVAMAGDGINDAIAIKTANIGVAVKNSVDWVKDIAGIVVTGGFDSLINAVEEGRKIIYKARLFTHYLLSGNISQVGVFILASVFTKYPPLSSLQLLVINLLTDTLPALALAYEDVPGLIMREKPEPASEKLINKPIWFSVIIQGVIASSFLFWVFLFFLPQGLIYAQTMTFIAYLCQKLYRAFTARSFTQSIFKLGFFSNKITVFSVAGSSLVACLLVAVFPSFVGMQKVGLHDFIIVAVLALVVPVAEEIFKRIRKIIG